LIANVHGPVAALAHLDPHNRRVPADIQHQNLSAYLEAIQDGAARESCKTSAHQERASKALGCL